MIDNINLIAIALIVLALGFIFLLIKSKEAFIRFIMYFGGNSATAVLIAVLNEAIKGDFDKALSLLNPLNSIKYYDYQIVYGDTWLGITGTIAWLMLFASFSYEMLKIFAVDVKKERKYLIPISFLLGLFFLYGFGGLRITFANIGYVIVKIMVISITGISIIFMTKFLMAIRNVKPRTINNTNLRSYRDRNWSDDDYIYLD